MRISQKTIDAIFNTVVIEDVIGDFISLKKNGANFKGLSPFNNEKTPSFVVSPSKEIWKDFSSGKGGNVISFLMEHEQLSYPEALTYIAKKYNIEIEYVELSSKQEEEYSERESTIIVHEFINSLFQKNLNNSTNAIKYLKSRGVNLETITRFEIGYCPQNDNMILSDIRKGGYNIQYLQKTKVLNSSGRSRFGGRIIFPIHNISNRVVGFGARILLDNNKGAKYINSDSSNIYQKSKILYGLHLAKKHIKLNEACYVVEGYTDVMALSQFGIKNVVSPCGTAFTADQIRLIHRFTKNIILLFDSDSAGEKATFTAIDEILKQGMFAKVLRLPPNEDPSSFIQNNPKEFIENYISTFTIDFIKFKASLISNELTSEERIAKIKNIISSLQLIEDDIAQNIYIKQSAKQLGLDESLIMASVKKTTKHKRTQVKLQESPSLVFSKKDYQALQKNNIEEFQLIRLLILYGETVGLVDENPHSSIFEFITINFKEENYNFTVPIFKLVFKEIVENLNNNKLCLNYFLKHSNKNIASLSSFILGEKHILSNWQNKDISVTQETEILVEVLTESLLRFKLKIVQEMVQDSLNELKGENTTEKLIDEFTQLTSLEKKIRQELGRIT